MRVADQDQGPVAVRVAARAQRPVLVDLEVLALPHVGPVLVEVEQRGLEPRRDVEPVLGREHRGLDQRDHRVLAEVRLRVARLLPEVGTVIAGPRR